MQRRRTAGWQLGVRQGILFPGATFNGAIHYKKGTRMLGADPVPEESFNEGSTKAGIWTLDAGWHVRLDQQPRWAWQNGLHAQYSGKRLISPDLLTPGGRISGDRLNISANNLENHESGHITQRGPYPLNIHTASYDTATSPYNSIRTRKPGASADSAAGTDSGGLTFARDAKFEFKENARITSDSFISNEGQLAACGTMLLKAATTIENRHNAKIQGGHVAIEAQRLTNFDGASIAAAGRMDLAAGEIINEHGAEITSVGNLHVGRKLDGNHQATGRADLLRNDNNGRINVIGGDATFNAARIENPDSQKFVGQKTRSTKVRFYSDMWAWDKWIPEELRTRDLNITNNRFPYLYDYTLQETHDVVENRAPGTISVSGKLTVNADSANNEGHIAAGSIDGSAQNLLNGSEWTGSRIRRVQDGRYGEYRPHSRRAPRIGDYLMFGQYSAPEIHKTITLRLGSTNFGGNHTGNPYGGGGSNGGSNGGGGNNGTTIVDTIDKNGKTVTYQTISDYQPALPQNILYQINPDNIAAPDSIPTNPARGLDTLDPTFARILQKRRPELFGNGELMRSPMNPHYDRYSDLAGKNTAYSGTTRGAPYIDFSRSIGDRYYNQQLVTSQIARLTGYRDENAAKDAGKNYHNSHSITAGGRLKRYATGSTVILGEADETSIGPAALDLGDKTGTTLIRGKKTSLDAEYVYDQTLDKKKRGQLPLPLPRRTQRCAHHR